MASLHSTTAYASVYHLHMASESGKRTTLGKPGGEGGEKKFSFRGAGEGVSAAAAALEEDDDEEEDELESASAFERGVRKESSPAFRSSAEEPAGLEADPGAASTRTTSSSSAAGLVADRGFK